MGLQANGTTNYSDALNTDVGILKNENAGGSGALTGAQTAGYFLSDGAPNTDTISGSTNYGFGTTAGDTNPSSGLSTLEQKTWNSVLASTGVKEYALGYGAANVWV